MIDKITCPNCAHQFDIEDALANDLEKTYQARLDEERQKMLRLHLDQQKQLELEKADFERKKEKENDLFRNRLDKARESQEAEIRKRLNDDFQVKIESQMRELNESREKVRALQNKEEELLRMQRKMDEVLKEKDIELQRTMLEERRNMETELAKSIRAEIELKLVEKDKKLEDQHKLIVELRRKSEQGSMQMQGEVQELAIEEFLRQEFPFDKVEEVPKGMTGADTVQTVINEHQQECGIILFESKRTKNFSQDWIDKLRVDQRTIQADIAVLVTETMPRNTDQFTEIKGVWVCTFEEFKSLIFVLRAFILRLATAREAKINKGDKMEVLYHFLTSDEFRLQVSGIVDGFTHLKSELEREKVAMRNIWKRREKRLSMVIGNTVDMYASIKGIAGAAIPTIEALELPSGEEEEEEGRMNGE